MLLILRECGSAGGSRVLPSFLSDPDPTIRFAAIQWVGEQRLTEFRRNCRRAWPRAAETRNLFEATLAALERLDGKSRGPKDEVAGEDYVVALLNDPQTPAPVLAARA